MSCDFTNELPLVRYERMCDLTVEIFLKLVSSYL